MLAHRKRDDPFVTGIPVGERHVNAPAGLVVAPVVIAAAKPVIVGLAPLQADVLMSTEVADQSDRRVLVPVADEVFAEESDRLDGILDEYRNGEEGLPVARTPLRERSAARVTSALRVRPSPHRRAKCGSLRRKAKGMRRDVR